MSIGSVNFGNRIDTGEGANRDKKAGQAERKGTCECDTLVRGQTWGDAKISTGVTEKREAGRYVRTWGTAVLGALNGMGRLRVREGMMAILAALVALTGSPRAVGSEEAKGLPRGRTETNNEIEAEDKREELEDLAEIRDLELREGAAKAVFDEKRKAVMLRPSTESMQRMKAKTAQNKEEKAKRKADDDAIEALRSIAEKGTDAERGEALEKLIEIDKGQGYRGDVRAIRALSALAESASIDVRRAAIEALTILTTENQSGARRALQNLSGERQGNLLHALDNLRTTEDEAVRKGVTDGVEKVAERGNGIGISALEYFAAKGDEASLTKLKEIAVEGNARAVESLLHIAGRGQIAGRPPIKMEGGDGRVEQGKEPNDDMLQMRKKAIDAVLELCHMGNRRALESLESLLGTGDNDELRKAAELYEQQYDYERASRCLEKLVMQQDETQNTEAIAKLEEMANLRGSRESLMMLERLARDGNRDAMVAVVKLYGQGRGDTAWKPRGRHNEKTNPPKVEAYLEMVTNAKSAEKAERAVDWLGELAEQGERAALMTIWKIAQRGTASALRTLLGVVERAAEKLTNLRELEGGDKAGQALVLGKICRPTVENGKKIRKILGKSKTQSSARAVKYLEIAAKDGVEDVRNAAVGELKDMMDKGSKKATKALKRLESAVEG